MPIFLLSWSAVGLMVIVWVHQRWRMTRYGQSAWKGGGFGMFSDIQATAISPSVVAMGADGVERHLAVESNWGGPTSVIPTTASLTKTAKQIAEGRWIESNGWAIPCTTRPNQPELRLIAVTVRALRVDFDASTGTHSSSRFHHVAVSR